MRDRVLIVDRDAALGERLQLLLSTEGYQVLVASDPEDALTRLDRATFEVVVCDASLVDADGQSLPRLLIRRLPDTTVIAFASDPAQRERALREWGVYDCLSKPLEDIDIRLALGRAEERGRLRRVNALLERDLRLAVGDRPIVAASSAMIQLLETTERVSAFDAPVLLVGEGGSGKEVLARAIHAQSVRRRGAFVALRCGGTSESDLEAQLFGHARGALPGADRPQPGLVVAAEGGTLFLDEIGDLPHALQLRVLRVLQDEEVRPVGENKSRPVDVRLLAATARDLEASVKAGDFVGELYSRLESTRLTVPPLRERPEDIPLLVDHFFARACRILSKPLHALSEDALERLVTYPWPGNIRELENVMERAVLLAEGGRVTLRELPEAIASRPRDAQVERGRDFALRRARKSLEADLIRRALRATGGNRTRAARLLEISHRALLYKIKEYEISD